MPTLLIVAALALAGCAEPELNEPADGGVIYFDIIISDTYVTCPNPDGDHDGDGIPNQVEGCLTGRDSDADKIPDWQDTDSDGDKLPDAVEKGPQDGNGKCVGAKGIYEKCKVWPCDTDCDGVPDYLDKDSDGDGLQDGHEDKNHDGALGCCLTRCNTFNSAWQKANCKLTLDGCGDGQKCAAGLCVPPAAWLCSQGETSPLSKDQKGGAFICRDATESKPGVKPVQLRKDTTGDWQVALEPLAKYGAIKIAGATAKMAAASIDFAKASDEVAGFVLSMNTTATSIQAAHGALISALSAANTSTMAVRASGAQGKSHDRYDQIEGTTIELTPNLGMDVSSARNAIVAALLGKKVADLSNVTAPFGSSHTSLILRYTTVRRFAFKKDSAGKQVLDSQGHPVDDGDSSKYRLLVMGAIASKTNYQNPKRQTGFFLDDLANGTPLATAQTTVANACDIATIVKLPIADIIWVIDESGSMGSERQDVVNNANNFFSRALASGLDFRMGVTGVNSPSGTSKQCVGKFCSVTSTDSAHDGGTDRFLLPTEQTIFSACIKNPPCHEVSNEYSLVNAREAVKSHLPRAAMDSSKIRPDATLVIIVVTDESAYSLSGVLSQNPTCGLPPATRTKLDVALQPYLNLFTGATDPEAAAMYHIIGGICPAAAGCTAQINHGHISLANKLGGQTGSVCQKNLGNTLQAMIDTIVGKASPIKLDDVPISSSMAVALDAVQIFRSRTKGFDYRASSNALAFINVKYKKGSEVIASYKRWK